MTRVTPIHSSAKLDSSPLSVRFFCSCDKVYHKLEVRFLLYLLGQIVPWQSTLIHWIQIDHVLLTMIMIDSWETVYSFSWVVTKRCFRLQTLFPFSWCFTVWGPTIYKLTTHVVFPECQIQEKLCQDNKMAA